ncbi:hypothetical protein TNCV_652321 [Trichonephila clavipes]|nr:hypothetical protein TNCV_652321 [Trichonephila clavipes]
MECISGQSFISSNKGRVDDEEMIPPAHGVSQISGPDAIKNSPCIVLVAWSRIKITKLQRSRIVEVAVISGSLKWKGCFKTVLTCSLIRDSIDHRLSYDEGMMGSMMVKDPIILSFCQLTKTTPEQASYSSKFPTMHMGKQYDQLERALVFISSSRQ